MRKLLFLGLFGLLTSFSFFAPIDVQAAIVPCDGPNCQTCDFIQLGNNILQWIIGVMASVCAIIIIMAGFKMATAGGNSGAISEAKGMISNVIVGFVILLAAWIIVDTVLRILVSGSSSTGSGDGSAAVIPKWGPWNEIQCVDQPSAPSTGGTQPPPTAGACTIPELTALPADGPVAQMEAMNGNAVIWTNTDPRLQACADKFVRSVGGSVVSAYRPQGYQDHLKEVHSRWCTQGLSTNTNPECSILKSAVSTEMRVHSLSCSRPVGTVSVHTSGRAVDISGRNLAHGSQEVLAAASAACLSWPLGNSDPVHYELKSGCTCN